MTTPLSAFQDALPDLLVTWYGDVLESRELYEEQLEAALLLIKEEGHEEEACLLAAQKARADFISGAQCGRGGLDFSPNAHYALSIIKAFISSSKGGRGGVLSIPGGDLIHRDATGRVPVPSTGLIVVSVTAAGERRFKAQLASLKSRLGVTSPWNIQAEPFLSSFSEVRTAMVSHLQSDLREQLLLLKFLEYGGKTLGKDQRRAQSKNVLHQEGIARKLLSRLRLWMRGGFLGLSSICPEGSWDGREWRGNWSDDNILKEKKTPWVHGGAGDNPGVAETHEELGCVSPRAYAVSCVGFPPPPPAAAERGRPPVQQQPCHAASRPLPTCLRMTHLLHSP